MAERIVTITLNPALDLSTATERIKAGPKLRCRAPRFEPGGGGVNVSRVIAELGGASTAWVALGGSIGRMYEDLLRDEDIACTVMEAPGMTRLSVNVTEENTGEQYRFVLPGPEYDAEDAERALESLGQALEGSAFAVVSGSMPPGLKTGFMAGLAGLVRDMGVRLILDTSGQPLKAAVEKGVYLIKPNLREAQELAGRELPDMSARSDFAAELVDQGAVGAVVLSLGADGAIVVGEHTRLRLHAPEVEVNSAVGAGDSTIGALTLSLARGESLEEAARVAVAAGSAAVYTSATALCRHEDVEDLLRKVRVDAL
jgi:6-phosphofructokinase 2